MNIHTPERQPNETQREYRERQRASKAAHKRITQPPRQAPAVNKFDLSRFFLGQHKASPERRERRACVKALGIRQFKKALRAYKLRAAIAQAETP